MSEKKMNPAFLWRTLWLAASLLTALCAQGQTPKPQASQQPSTELQSAPATAGSTPTPTVTTSDTGASAATLNPHPAPIESTTSPAQRIEVAKRLADLQEQISSRQQALNALRKATGSRPKSELTEDEVRALDILNQDVKRLQNSFEQLALGGLDISMLDPEAEKPYDWKAELLDVIKPVLGSLKDITEKPRRIEALRQQVTNAENQKELVDSAMSSLRSRLGFVEIPAVREDLSALVEQWQTRGRDIDNELEVKRFQLQSLQETTKPAWTAIRETVSDFMRGRGLTMLVALGAALVVWLLVRLVFAILRRLRQGQKRTAKRRRDRTLRYMSRLLTLLLMTIAVLAVFYVRSDVFLLALGILLLGLIFVGAREALPRYFAEIRLLTDFGAAREQERLLYEGVPMQVRDMGAFAILTNPDLKGFVRIPLNQLTKMNSRPDAGEPWFPSHSGDFVRFPDDRFARVVNQTIDTVTLRTAGSLMNMRTADYYAATPLNLSREGFVSVVTFGIGYRHQAICLTEVPDKMKAALQDAVATQAYGEHCQGILVEFKAAAANSLDYLIVLSMDGAAAEHYLGMARMIQRTLVALCNREQWEIPFAQIVVHAP